MIDIGVIALNVSHRKATWLADLFNEIKYPAGLRQCRKDEKK